MNRFTSSTFVHPLPKINLRLIELYDAELEYFKVSSLFTTKQPFLEDCHEFSDCNVILFTPGLKLISGTVFVDVV